MADISIPKPVHPAWPARPVKPASNNGDRRQSPSKRKPGKDQNGTKDNPDDPQHIDEYA